MKILIVVVGLSRGGTSVVVKNICPILMQKHEVTILTNDERILEIKCNKLIQLKSKSFPIKQYGYMPELKKILKSNELNEYDVIHIFDYPQFGADYLTIKKNKIKPPILLSPHGSMHQFSQFPLNIFKKIHNLIMLNYRSNITKFIAMSNAEKQHLINHKIPEEKIKIVPLGVNPSLIEHKEAEEKFVLYLGRLSKTKNIEVLIEAFEKCNFNNVKLILAGPDYGMQEKLKKIVKNYGLEKQIIFKGAVSENEKNELFSKATIFVHPSLEDVFSLALIEAASSGAPCIAFDIEANSEILDDMVTGKLVKNPTSDSLKESLHLLLSNDNLRLKISQNARKQIPEKFNWHKTVIALENVYKESINENQNH